MAYLGLELGRDPAEGDDVSSWPQILKWLRTEYGFCHGDADGRNGIFIQGNEGGERLVAMDLEEYELVGISKVIKFSVSLPSITCSSSVQYISSIQIRRHPFVAFFWPHIPKNEVLVLIYPNNTIHRTACQRFNTVLLGNGSPDKVHPIGENAKIDHVWQESTFQLTELITPHLESTTLRSSSRQNKANSSSSASTTMTAIRQQSRTSTPFSKLLIGCPCRLRSPTQYIHSKTGTTMKTLESGTRLTYCFLLIL
jgi:hypothetical protein